LIARQHGVEAHFYVDDSQMYIVSKPIESMTAEDRLLRCLDDMAEWMKSNRLCLNPSKSVNAVCYVATSVSDEHSLHTLSSVAKASNQSHQFAT